MPDQSQDKKCDRAAADQDDSLLFLDDITKASFVFGSIQDICPAPKELTYVDDIIDECGSLRLFTLLQILLYFLSFYCVSFPILTIIFMGYQTPHQCAVLTNETDVLTQHGLNNDSSATLHYQKCTIDLWTNNSGQFQREASMPCVNGNDYNGQRHISFVSEWEYVCDRQSGLVAFVQTSLMIGQGVGALLSSSLADKVGRRPVYLLCNLGLVVVGVGGAYTPNIYVLIILRFFTGFFQQGCGLVGFTLTMELLVPRHRRYIGTLSGTNWNFSVCVLSLIAYLMRDCHWRSLQLVSGLVGLNVVLNFFFMVESPRWLIANKKYDDALKIFKRMCWMHGKDFTKVQKLFDETISKNHEMNILTSSKHATNGTAAVDDQRLAKDGTETPPKYTVFDIFRNWTLLKISLIMWLTWITCSTTYYGLVLTSSSLAGNRYLNFFLMSVVDFPGDICIYNLLDRVGRRFLLIFAMSATSIGLLGASFLMAYGTSDLTSQLTLVFFLIGKFGIGVAFSAVFIYTPELFPTNLRSAGMGLCSSISRIGGMCAPYTQLLADIVLWGPGAIFATMCFLTGALCFKLPETKGRVLPTTIDEIKAWNSKPKANSVETCLQDEDAIESLPNEACILKKRFTD